MRNPATYKVKLVKTVIVYLVKVQALILFFHHVTHHVESFTPFSQPTLIFIYEVDTLPHSSPELPAQVPMLCMYLMRSNGFSACRSASQGKLL